MKESLLLNIVIALFAACVVYYVILPVVDKLIQDIGL